MGLICVSVRKMRSCDPATHKVYPGKTKTHHYNYKNQWGWQTGPLEFVPHEDELVISTKGGSIPKVGMSNDDSEISNSSPLPFFPHCCDPIPRLLELHLLSSNKVNVKEDIVREGILA